MKYYLLKANAKKNKFIKTQEDNESDSDGDLSDDNVDEISKDIIYKLYNNTYYTILYLGKGTFSKVWLVYNIHDNNFYAMKMMDEEFDEEAIHEIKINNIINNEKIVKFYENFIYIKEDMKYSCLIFELMGITLLDLITHFYDDDDDDNVSNDEYEDNEDSDDIMSDNSENSNLTLNISEYDDYSKMPLYIFKYIFSELLLSIDSLHKKNVIHTDLKPENIMCNIFTTKINNLINYINTNIIINTKSSNFNEFVINNLPENYESFEKNKRKNIKKKIKLKSIKEYCKIIETTIISFYNDTSHIKEIDETKLFDFDFTKEKLSNLQIKIGDFGNSEIFNDKCQDTISIAIYRPPENIINDYYDTKSDIWSLGCIAFEMLTGEYLFSIDDISKKNKIKHMLYEIGNVCGKIPRDMALNCINNDLFDNKGNIYKYKKSEYMGIKDILINDFEYDICDSENINNFLINCLEYDINKRATAIDLYNNDFLKMN